MLTREQTFSIVGHRPPTSQTVTLGARRVGTLTAIKHDGISGALNEAFMALPTAPDAP